MKIKFKCTPNQYSELVHIIGQLPYDRIAVSNLELINLKYFYFEGLQKMQTLNFNSPHKKNLDKLKAFTMDINHYEAIKRALIECGNIVSQYNKSVFKSIELSVEPQIDRQVSGFKLIG